MKNVSERRPANYSSFTGVEPELLDPLELTSLICLAISDSESKSLVSFKLTRATFLFKGLLSTRLVKLSTRFNVFSAASESLVLCF